MLASMLAAFAAELDALRQTQAAFDAFVRKQRRRHRAVLLFAAGITALAWACELSTMLRWYVLPIVAALVLVFTVGARICQGRAARKLAQLTRQHRLATRQLARLTAAAAPAMPPR